MRVSTVSQMREMDQAAIEKFGIPSEILMENAGQAVYEVIRTQFGIQDKSFLIICGSGNNGGDGLVVARKLHANGGKVEVVLMSDPQKFKNASKLNYQILTRLSIKVFQFEYIDQIHESLKTCDATVDAIFGTGLDREVGGRYREVINAINNSEKTVFSIDIPSGIHGDSGQIMGIAVKANYTVTFGLPKTGNLLYPGYDFCGKLYATHISFPASLTQFSSIKTTINHPPSLPHRVPDGHKGTFGQALFIAGASGYYGAPYFAAMSFLKAGGGYSRLATPKSNTPFIASKGSEIVFIPQEETISGSIALSNKEALRNLSDKMDFIVLGPGMSLDNEAQELIRYLAREIGKPLLIDGDGITAICKEPNFLQSRSAPTVLTPHMGEMSRLTGIAIEDIKRNPIEILQNTAKELNSIIVLKGAHSLIGAPDQSVFINMSGNSGMASAGSGDVLTGTIAAMHGLGLSIQDAVQKGVFIHGLSGDLAATEKGEDGITAQDILEYLPYAVKLDREGLPPDLQRHCDGLELI